MCEMKEQKAWWENPSCVFSLLIVIVLLVTVVCDFDIPFLYNKNPSVNTIAIEEQLSKLKNEDKQFKDLNDDQWHTITTAVLDTLKSTETDKMEPQSIGSAISIFITNRPCATFMLAFLAIAAIPICICFYIYYHYNC